MAGALAALAGACAPGDATDDLGTLQQEFASPQNEVNLSDAPFGIKLHDLATSSDDGPPDPPSNTLNPSVAWIRTPNHPTAGTPSKGTVLAAFTRRVQDPTTGTWFSDAVWGFSSTWTLGAATYTELSANDSYILNPGAPDDELIARHRWPAPSNLCPYYPNFAECGTGSTSWYSESLAHWHEPAAALWTGLDRTAAIVTTGGPNASLQNDAVFIVTSNDGGESFQRSLIISIEEGGPHTMPTFDTEEPVGSGGKIVSGSVHASLANFGERTSTLAGRVSLPIYVVWQHQIDYEKPEWWWTRVEVGESGYIAQTTPPQRLPDTVPRDPGVRVSIFGYRIDGEERVGIAWAERGDQATPNSCTSADTNVPVAWYAASTADLGETWGCFMGNEPTVATPGGPVPYFDGCADGKTTIASVTNWPTCARVHATSPMPNSVRPEVAMNAPARNDGNGIDEDHAYRYWYFGLTMPRSTGTDMFSKVCVYRTGSVEHFVPGAPAQDHDDILPIGCTTTSDPSGRDVGQTYAPAIAVAQGTTDGPRVEVSYRTIPREASTGRQDVMTLEHALYPSQTPTPDFDHLAAGDFPLDVGQWGTRSGLAVYERCDPYNTAACPLDGNYTNSDAGFAGAWSDTRRVLSPRVTDTLIRTFDWE